METLEMRRMRELKQETDARSKLSKTEKNKVLTHQILQIVESWAKAQHKALLLEKQHKAHEETKKINSKLTETRRKRIESGGKRKCKK